jgi:iron-sulfur cluster assembly protein
VHGERPRAAGQQAWESLSHLAGDYQPRHSAPFRAIAPAQTGVVNPFELAQGGQGHQPRDPTPIEVRCRIVLTLTDRAAATIRTLTSQPGVPEDTGLRMSLQDSDAGTLALSLEGPQPDDAIIEDGGARVFVQRDAAAIVEDRELDAELDDQGRASFMLGSQTG